MCERMNPRPLSLQLKQHNFTEKNVYVQSKWNKRRHSRSRILEQSWCAGSSWKHQAVFLVLPLPVWPAPPWCWRSLPPFSRRPVGRHKNGYLIIQLKIQSPDQFMPLLSFNDVRTLYFFINLNVYFINKPKEEIRVRRKLKPEDVKSLVYVFWSGK